MERFNAKGDRHHEPSPWLPLKNLPLCLSIGCEMDRKVETYDTLSHIFMPYEDISTSVPGFQPRISDIHTVLQNKSLNKQCEIVDNITQLQKTLEIYHQQRDDLQAKSTNLTNIMNMKGDKCRPCPESWIQHGEKCYHFSKDMKTWHKSKEYCSSWGSLLLKIENKKELFSSKDTRAWRKMCTFQS
ncbi:C-type lectin domain family 12 member A-like [Gopherus flavomarginatus]|uniref:C-type lectin domain family 12 member A-like n=1 Tax=Gopherus flavomarginatus TaxID=286002 RepID=UPI0021CC30EA|nr:C-type lectin domain family 12 member A-like [Gopherus flavomarginatus]